jgi:hypothetical protein
LDSILVKRYDLIDPSQQRKCDMLLTYKLPII